MTITPIGFFTILLGLVCLRLGYRATMSTFIFTAMFGAAAAMFIGGANISPAHFFMIFSAVAVLTRRREAAAAIRAIKPPEPGFWLLCLVVLGVASAALMPRILAGATDIIPLGVSQYADTGSTVPLGPVSSNFTQSVYLIGNLLCFCLIVAIASTKEGFMTVLTALIVFCAANVFFALIDIGTYTIGAQALLDPIRNARYTFHHEEEVYGLKRIVGTYTEASSFARATLGAFGFTGTLWLCGYKPGWTGLLAFASLMLVVLSTSSAGLAGAAVVAVILYVTAFNRCGARPNARRSSAVVLFAPLISLAVFLIVLLDPQMSAAVTEYVDIVLLSKSTTSSGTERSMWNAAGIQNFIDSWGVGVGLGTVRTSSFAVALLANVGLWGTVLYILFATTGFLRSRGIRGSFGFDVRLAARNACLSLLIGDLMVGPTVDQGIFFYVLAGLASAYPERKAVTLLLGTAGPYVRRAT